MFERFKKLISKDKAETKITHSTRLDAEIDVTATSDGFTLVKKRGSNIKHGDSLLVAFKIGTSETWHRKELEYQDQKSGTFVFTGERPTLVVVLDWKRLQHVQKLGDAKVGVYKKLMHAAVRLAEDDDVQNLLDPNNLNSPFHSMLFDPTDRFGFRHAFLSGDTTDRSPDPQPNQHTSHREDPHSAQHQHHHAATQPTSQPSDAPVADPHAATQPSESHTHQVTHHNNFDDTSGHHGIQGSLDSAPFEVHGFAAEERDSAGLSADTPDSGQTTDVSSNDTTSSVDSTQEASAYA